MIFKTINWVQLLYNLTIVWKKVVWNIFFFCTRLYYFPFSFKVVKEAMWKGHTGITNILDIMHECIEEPRNDKSNLPLTDSLTIPVTKRGKFIGPGGNNLKKILTETGVQVWH